MKNSYTIGLLLLSATTIQAQHLTSITFNPTNPTECNLLDLHLHGNMPMSGNFTQFVPPPIDNDTLLLLLYAEGGTNGNSNFNQSLPGLGPYAPGTYTFYAILYYNGNLADTWTTTLVIAPGFNPNAGEFNDSIVCNTGPDIPLISFLGGTPDPGGVWYDPFNQVVSNGQFDPGQSPEGPYSYVFDVQPPCIDAFQQVVITYVPNSNGGLNASFQTCGDGSGATVNLFATLNGTPDPGGTWTAPGGAPHSNLFNPSVDPCGLYTYTVVGTPPCGNPSSTVTVQCVTPPNAGNGGMTVYLCFDDSSHVLQGFITGEPNTGYWIDPVAGFFLGPFNAPINVAINGSGNYGYVVAGGSYCPNDTAFVNVILDGPPCDIGVNEVDGNVQRFDLAPNPAEDQVALEVELGHAAPGQILDIIDVNGAIVHTEALNFNGTIARRTLSLGHLSRGAYMVRITSAEGRAVRRLMLR